MVQESRRSAAATAASLTAALRGGDQGMVPRVRARPTGTGAYPCGLPKKHGRGGSQTRPYHLAVVPVAPTGDANCRAGARRIRNFARALGVGLLFLALPGCYSSHTRMPDRLQTLAVPVFANRTYLDDYTRRLEVEVSDSVRQTFLQTSRLKLVGRETADLVLEGDILKLARTALRVDRYGDPAEVKLQITGRISLYDVKEAKYVFRNLVVSNDLARPSSGTYNLRRGESEDQGRRRAVEDLARNIVRAVLDHW